MRDECLVEAVPFDVPFDEGLVAASHRQVVVEYGHRCHDVVRAVPARDRRSAGRVVLLPVDKHGHALLVALLPVVAEGGGKERERCVAVGCQIKDRVVNAGGHDARPWRGAAVLVLPSVLTDIRKIGEPGAWGRAFQ